MFQYGMWVNVWNQDGDSLLDNNGTLAQETMPTILNSAYLAGLFGTKLPKWNVYAMGIIGGFTQPMVNVNCLSSADTKRVCEILNGALKQRNINKEFVPYLAPSPFGTIFYNVSPPQWEIHLKGQEDRRSNAGMTCLILCNNGIDGCLEILRRSGELNF